MHFHRGPRQQRAMTNLEQPHICPQYIESKSYLLLPGQLYMTSSANVTIQALHQVYDCICGYATELVLALSKAVTELPCAPGCRTQTCLFFILIACCRRYVVTNTLGKFKMCLDGIASSQY